MKRKNGQVKRGVGAIGIERKKKKKKRGKSGAVPHSLAKRKGEKMRVRRKKATLGLLADVLGPP